MNSLKRLVRCEECHELRANEHDDCPKCRKAAPAVQSPGPAAAAPSAATGPVPVLLPGSWLASRFEIVCRVPNTGLERTYLGRDHSRGGEPIFVELLISEQARTEAFRRTVERAITRCQRHGLQNLFAVRELVEVPIPALIADYVPGLSLVRLAGGPVTRGEAFAGMPLARALGLIHQLARAIERMHQAGLFHGDLRADSVLADRAHGTEELHIIDIPLGAAGPAEMHNIIDVGEVHACRSPELIQRVNVGPAADIYALGAIAYWLLAGRPPHEVSDLETGVPARPPPIARIPPAANQVLARALDRQPRERYYLASAFASDLERTTRGLLPAHEPVAVSRSVRKEGTPPWMAGMERTFWTLIVLLVLVLGSMNLVLYSADVVP